jgi:hypothetical protein
MARSFALLEPLCFALLCLPGLYYGSTIRNAAVFTQLAHASLFAAVAFVCAYMLIPALGPRFLARGLKGKDMGRRGTAAEHVEMCVQRVPGYPVQPSSGPIAHPCLRCTYTHTYHFSSPSSPSGLGLVCAVVFLICAILIQAWVDPPIVGGQPKMVRATQP